MEFIELLHQYSRAATGVLVVRSKESYRAQEEIHDYAFSQERPFAAWETISGWTLHPYLASPDISDNEPQNDPKTSDIMAALRVLDSDERYGEAVCLMHSPHFFLKLPPVIQTLKKYAVDFTRGRRRLILLVPLSFSLPEELVEDIPILDFDTPGPEALRTLWADYFEDNPGTEPPFDDPTMDRIISIGAGMTRVEFETAIARAAVNFSGELPDVEPEKFIRFLLEVKIEIVKRHDALELMRPDTMENVGGLDNLKAYIQTRRVCFDDAAREFGIDPPKGILLVGPPGTGKSLCAKAAASILGIPAIRFDVSTVRSSLVGESEKRMKSALKLIEGMAPVVLMLDEVDKIFDQKTSGGGDSGVGTRLLGQLLTWMQENSAPVYSILTANNADSLPPELTRKGRLDEIFSLTLPNETERREILSIHLRKRKQNPEKIPGLALAVKKSRNFVASEIEVAVNEALIDAFVNDRRLTGETIAEQFDQIKPISVSFKEQIERMRTWAENNARPASRPVIRDRQKTDKKRAVE